MISFLTSNASKVYYFFGSAWDNAKYLFDTIFNQIISFFIFTLPFQLAPIFPHIYKLISYATTLHQNLSNFIYIYYNKVAVLIGLYYFNLVNLAGVLYGSLQTLIYSMYSSLQTIVFSLFSKITHLTVTYYNYIITLVVMNYNALLIYATRWYTKAVYIFDVIYSSLIYVASSLFIDNVNRLSEFIPSIINLGSLPFYALWNLCVTSYNLITSTVVTLAAHATLLAVNGVALITTLFPFIPNILHLVTGSYWNQLSILVADATQGFPMLREIVRRDINTWLQDHILDLLESAIDRFW